MRESIAKVLVTGGCGFIGSHLVDELVRRNYEVVVLDNLEYQVHRGRIPDHLNKQAHYIFGDIRSRSTVKKALDNVQVILHLAAAVGVGQSMYQIKKYVDTNIGGTANVLDILASGGSRIAKIVFASSATVYGECACSCRSCGLVFPNLRAEEQIGRGSFEPACPLCGKENVRPVPTPEDKPMKCDFFYALTKKTSEELCLSFGRTYKVPVVILRYFNVYGPRQSLLNPYSGVIPVFSGRLRNNKAPIIIEDGLQTRDFVSVYDVVSATLLAMEKSEADYKVFNVGSGEAVTIRQLAGELTKLHHKEIQPTVSYLFRKGDVRHSWADISKIKKQLGWVPKVPLQDGLRDLFEWSKSRPVEDRFREALNELVGKGLTVEGHIE